MEDQSMCGGAKFAEALTWVTKDDMYTYIHITCVLQLGYIVNHFTASCNSPHMRAVSS